MRKLARITVAVASVGLFSMNGIVAAQGAAALASQHADHPPASAGDPDSLGERFGVSDGGDGGGEGGGGEGGGGGHGGGEGGGGGGGGGGFVGSGYDSLQAVCYPFCA